MKLNQIIPAALMIASASPVPAEVAIYDCSGLNASDGSGMSITGQDGWVHVSGTENFMAVHEDFSPPDLLNDDHVLYAPTGFEEMYRLNGDSGDPGDSHFTYSIAPDSVFTIDFTVRIGNWKGGRGGVIGLTDAAGTMLFSFGPSKDAEQFEFNGGGAQVVSTDQWTLNTYVTLKATIDLAANGGAGSFSLEASQTLDGALADVAGMQDLNMELASQEFAGLYAFMANGCAVGDISITYEPRRFRLTVARDGSDLDFEWDSRAGMLYNLKSSPDLAAWTLVEGDIPADPPANTKTIPRPADPLLFYRVEEYPAPPVLVFSENFDGTAAPALPTGWTSGANTPPDTGTTAWELGAPTNVGPATANSPDNCCATNLAADYGFDTDIWLRTKAIDLTAHTAGTLEFKEFKDIEDAVGDFDFGTVRILAADDLEELAVLTAEVEGTSGKWEAYSEALPATAFDEPVIIEFQFQADGIDNFAGWYLDDVTVSVPAS